MNIGLNEICKTGEQNVCEIHCVFSKVDYSFSLLFCFHTCGIKRDGTPASIQH